MLVRLPSRSGFVLAVPLAAAAAILLPSPRPPMAAADFGGPFGSAELRTIRRFTWAGERADGRLRHLYRMEDFAALPTLSLWQQGMGLSCSLGRWPEPNSHVVYSVLCNLALPAWRD